MPKIKFTIITLFQEALKPYLDSSMLYKAQERGIIEVNYVNLRDFGLGPHKSVDDTPYGGGDGMLLRCEPVFAAIESIKSQDSTAKVILPTPVGETWTQDLARQFAGIENAVMLGNTDGGQKVVSGASATNGERTEQGVPVTNLGGVRAKKTLASSFEVTTENLSEAKMGHDEVSPEQSSAHHQECLLHYIILCPHYEGYDERILSIVDYKISLGNYILTGGELPALILIDSISRLLPGVLGGETSAEIESFSDGDNLEYPQYTKPAEFRGMKVPDVLLSGHHENVAKWRIEHSGRKG